MSSGDGGSEHKNADARTQAMNFLSSVMLHSTTISKNKHLKNRKSKIDLFGMIGN